MKKNEPESLGEILSDLKQTTHLGKLLEQAQIWERWPELAGPRLAPHGQPVGFRAKRPGTLVIAAESPVWMHRFAFKKWDIIRRINRMARRELVSDIFVTHAGDEASPTALGASPSPPQHDV